MLSMPPVRRGSFKVPRRYEGSNSRARPKPCCSVTPHRSSGYEYHCYNHRLWVRCSLKILHGLGEYPGKGHGYVGTDETGILDLGLDVCTMFWSTETVWQSGGVVTLGCREAWQLVWGLPACQGLFGGVYRQELTPAPSPSCVTPRLQLMENV